MQVRQNGMPAAGLTEITWVAPQHGDLEDASAEMAALPGGSVAMRNSGDPDGPALIYTQAEIAAFIAGAKDGDFDHLIF
jgi:hypothetical protein